MPENYNREHIKVEVYRIFSDNFNKKTEDLSDNIAFDSLNADSLDTTRIIMDIEDKFPSLGRINDEDAEKMKTIGNIVEYVYSKISSGDDN